MNKLLTLGALMLLTACGRSDNFEVDVMIDGLGAEEVKAVYVTDRGVQQVMARATPEGKFSIVGSSADPVMLELSRSDGSLLATLVVTNGDRMNFEMSLSRPNEFKVSGNAVNESIAAFHQANRALIGNPVRRHELDRVIAGYIGRHRGDMVSTMLLMTLFDTREHPLYADSLFNLIEPQARPLSLTSCFKALLSVDVDDYSERFVGPFTVYGANDSLTGFVASGKSYSVLTFTPVDKPDSVRSLLSRLRGKYTRRRLEVMEIAMWGDSAAWKRAVRKDTVSWTRAWVPGGPATPAIRHLTVPRTPFFIVIDSIGRQKMRSSSATAVGRFIDSCLINSTSRN